MPEVAPADRVCPYLRGRSQREPVLQPSWDNHCTVIPAIHLPAAQQARYCLGGRYAECPRFRRQRDRPLPSYVTGVPTSPPPPTVVVPDRPVLWWRRPWGRRVLTVLMAMALLGLGVAGWHWRAARLDKLPTPVPVPTPSVVLESPVSGERSPYLPPLFGPMEGYPGERGPFR
jgi:hypothetical protein